MKLTREEAIKRHRELWGWLAENPTKNKRDWPGWKKYGRIQNDCFCCELAITCGRGDCALCPFEWPKTRKGYTLGCMPCDESYFGNWKDATTPEERAKYAALIRDLPEKKEEPKFKVGDKVRVREDLVPGQTYGDIHLLNEMADLRGQVGTIIIISGDGNFGLDIGYVWDASMLERVSARFKVGDKVVPVSKSAERSADWDKFIASEVGERFKSIGYMVVHEIKSEGDIVLTVDKIFPGVQFWYFLESDLIPYVKPKYHAAENYSCCEIVVNQYDRKTIYNGPATICIINLEGKDYKGIARCAPDDTFDEEFGKALAEMRAYKSAFEDAERTLLGR